eukprot:CAMPEP_0118708990 /NCGR_PEP_ID=MMETSP0800-20121206/22300_1 /TAXON_ID=210618 ORGANISM="Striatella unipunctata, Strain CCMP2910" /NCGR_SAMPLE_ID=MMETSP0800 /ASSEMBLY_ACC=CAM_ASM_000638 /LENGTH=490 /DNA_ID=CAMNT_0006612457 /DNA_START=67 /DNA_END=1539 /DNA_ORIENTATION=+
MKLAEITISNLSLYEIIMQPDNCSMVGECNETNTRDVLEILLAMPEEEHNAVIVEGNFDPKIEWGWAAFCVFIGFFAIAWLRLDSIGRFLDKCLDQGFTFALLGNAMFEWLNETCMSLEDMFWTWPTQETVFVAGGGATDGMYRALSNLHHREKSVCRSYANDRKVPSLILKYILYPLASLFEQVVVSLNLPKGGTTRLLKYNPFFNFSSTSSQEEEALLFPFAKELKNPTNKKELMDAMRPRARSIQHSKDVVSRSLYFNHHHYNRGWGAEAHQDDVFVHIGNAPAYTPQWLWKNYSEQAKCVVVVRHPKDAIPMLLNRLGCYNNDNNSGMNKKSKFSSPSSCTSYTQVAYQRFCKPHFKELAQLGKMYLKQPEKYYDRVFFVDYQDWKNDKRECLSRIAQWFGMEVPHKLRLERNEDFDDSYYRSIHASAPELIAQEKLILECQPYFDSMQRACYLQRKIIAEQRKKKLQAKLNAVTAAMGNLSFVYK